MPRPPRRLTNAAYAPCLSACCSSRALQAAGAAGAQPPPQSMATAFSKLRGAGELTLLLRAVIVLAVLGAHAVCGAHAALEQHPAALAPVAAEAMVHHTLRALVKSLAADAAIPDGRGWVSCAWSGSPASPTQASPPTPHGGSSAQPGTRGEGPRRSGSLAANACRWLALAESPRGTLLRGRPASLRVRLVSHGRAATKGESMSHRVLAYLAVYAPVY